MSRHFVLIAFTDLVIFMTEPTLSASRAIVLDVETTGLDPRDNHYIVEVAALELINMVPSSAYFHHYINPLRDDVPQEVVKIHGITERLFGR